jgi:hypothetical protein
MRGKVMHLLRSDVGPRLTLVLLSDYTTGKVMSSIKEMLPAEVEILRNGERTSVEPKNLVLGDLVWSSVRIAVIVYS